MLPSRAGGRRGAPVITAGGGQEGEGEQEGKEAMDHGGKAIKTLWRQGIRSLAGLPMTYRKDSLTPGRYHEE